MEVENFASVVRRSSLTVALFLIPLIQSLFSSSPSLFFFLSVHDNVTLFHSFYHLLRQCMTVSVCPLSRPVPIYDCKAAEARGPRTPLSNNPPTILTFPRSPALGVTYFFPSSILPPSLHHQSRRHLLASIISFPSFCLLFLQHGSLPLPPPGSLVVQDFATHS